MTIAVAIPAMLAQTIGTRTVDVNAETVGDALQQLAAHPRLGPLIFDDKGRVRPHVLVFHNDTATRHMTTLDVALRDGDRISVVQAVSGG